MPTQPITSDISDAGEVNGPHDEDKSICGNKRKYTNEQHNTTVENSRMNPENSYLSWLDICPCSFYDKSSRPATLTQSTFKNSRSKIVYAQNVCTFTHNLILDIARFLDNQTVSWKFHLFLTKSKSEYPVLKLRELCYK